MHKHCLLLLFVSLLVPNLVFADDPTGGYLSLKDSAYKNCTDLGSSEVDSYNCHQRNFQRLDDQLNQLYGSLSNHANPTQKIYLQNMQLGWIKLKESQCDFISYYYSDSADGRSEAVKLECYIVMTAKRISDLQQIGTGLLW